MCTLQQTYPKGKKKKEKNFTIDENKRKEETSN